MFEFVFQMRGRLRDKVELRVLRLKRSSCPVQAPVSPAGRTTGSGRAILATFKLGTRVPSVPLLIHCVTKDLCENVAVTCSREDLMDRNSWLGLLEPGE